MKLILQFLLKIITTLVIKKYNPMIIGITGSVGKTSTKEAIYCAFSGTKKIRKSEGNLNTEIGAPLVFLGVKKGGQNITEWLSILGQGLYLLLIRDINYPDIIIVELAADKPGDIKYLTSFISPHIGIITAIGEVPVHIEFYKNAHEVAQEKENLLHALRKKSTAILNIDDDHIYEMHQKYKSKMLTFGFSEKADVQIKNFTTNSLHGSSLTIKYKKNEFLCTLPMCIGDCFAYIVASVFATGIELRIPPQEIPQLVKKILPTKGRMNLIEGINSTYIIDSSYNAAPESMISALSTLKKIPGKRKIAVLGDMLDLGKYSAQEHRKIGKIAGEFCDFVISIGENAHELRKAAINSGLKKDNALYFSRSFDAGKEIEKIIMPGDVILVKGSQGIRTEKVIFSIMNNPEMAEDILVRQDSSWKEK